jgi:hypothetical protein
MKRRSEPAANAGFQCIGPEHNGMALIMMSHKARQVPFAFDGHAACISPRCEGVKHGMPSVRLLTSAATFAGVADEVTRRTWHYGAIN